MGLFELIEKLINEHASAAVLREHLALVRTEFGLLSQKNADLTAELAKLRNENAALHPQIHHLQQRQRSVDTKYVCDHCGSPNIKRTGSRPDPTFGDVGVKQAVFRCEDCGKESGFTQEP